MGYAADIKGIKDALVMQIKTVSTYSNRVYAQSSRALKDYPACIVHPETDENEATGPNRTYHKMVFRVVPIYRGQGTASDMDDFLDLVGDTYDALISDRSLGNRLQTLEITAIDFTFREEESLIYDMAELIVECWKLRTA